MLIPREHGAYGQLLFPLVCVLVIGRPSAGAYLLAAAGVAAFLAHESLLVVIGQRGPRARREQWGEGMRSLVVFGGCALLSGAAAYVALPRPAIIATGGTFALALAVGAVVALHRERTTVGELLVAAALTSLSVGVAIAGGVSVRVASTVFLVFTAIFSAATVSVRAMIGRVARRGGPPPAAAGLLTAGALIVLALLARSGVVERVGPYAALPVCALAFGLTVRPPSPQRLRAVGWTLVALTGLTTIILMVAFA